MYLQLAWTFAIGDDRAMPSRSYGITFWLPHNNKGQVSKVVTLSDHIDQYDQRCDPH